MSGPNPEYWRRKLSAFLHDSPDKVISLLDHEDRARSLAQAEGFNVSETARKESDFAASAADRLPWPRSKLGADVLCRSEFDATDKAFKHPLGQSGISYDTDFKTALEGLDIAHATKPRLLIQDDARASFITVWRFWQNWASAQDERFAFLPAETRLPDHTVWNHLSVTSAMQGCCGGSQKQWIDTQSPGKDAPLPDRPAFLLFSLGPVQDFIAAARNTRDLWSGSYLLSYLVGSALARIALDFGPDHVIFPNLLNQPLLDLLLRGELWNHHKAACGEELWQAFDYYSDEGKRRLLTPSLPNRFLALLPAAMAEHAEWLGPDADGRTGAARYAAHLANSVRDRLNEIAKRVAANLEPLGVEFNRHRFLDQSNRILEIHWQILIWPDSVAEAKTDARQLPGEGKERPDAALKAIHEMIRRMPKDHRDPIYFAGRKVGSQEDPGQLKQVAAAWSALVAGISWRHDAVKATRVFDAWASGGWQSGADRSKDSLTGKEEACLTVPAEENKAAAWSRKVAGNPHVLKAGDRLGAPTLLKRFWHLAWLCREHTFVPDNFAMPNTRSVAAHNPWDTNADDEGGTEADTKYFAVLALDGDEMGKWISGVKCPELAGQLSEEAADYFRKHANADFLEAHRPLSPSFHLQFSELLGNFSLHCARRIVEAFDGRLIYAGGDDVLAMLPADTALECARALRAAFRGEKGLPELARGVVQPPGRRRPESKSDRRTRLFEVQYEGFVKLTEAASPDGFGAKASLLSDPVTFPIAVPGPAADASVGIAIAHFKSSLQDVVRAAQDAEKRAKKQLGRSAVAVTLFKRSGETIEWGTQWGSHGLEIYERMAKALQAGQVSSRFPYRVVALLRPYLTETTALSAKSVERVPDFDVASVIERELDHVVDHQGTTKEAKADLRREWLEPMADPANPNQLRRFLRWASEQEARAAARGLAEKLSSTGAKPEPPEAKALRELADGPIRDGSAHADKFKAIVVRLAGTGHGNDAVRKAAAKALEGFDKRVPEAQLHALIGLCQTVAFANRSVPEDKP